MDQFRASQPQTCSRCVLLGALAVFLTPLAAPPASAQVVITADSTAPTVFRDVRVFDGERVLPLATVVIEGDRITQVLEGGGAADVPAGANVVDGSGRTLLPGFIDAHTHTFSRAYIKVATGAGVTTQLDMFTSLDVMRPLKAEQERGEARDRADLFSSGILVTAPGGHGTQFGVPIPTISEPEEAEDFIDARLAESSDYIKIVVEDGSAFGMTTPTLDEATVRALVVAARARGVKAVVHVGDYDAALLALRSGADGLAHIFADRAPEADFGRRAAEQGVFVVPTLTVLEGTAGGVGGLAVIEDPVLGPHLQPAEISNLSISFPIMEGNTQSMQHAYQAVRLLHEAGVPILVGTDAPNPGTYNGVSMHRELELLVRAGLTPLEALAGATSVAADAFGLDDRGRIAPGLRADLLLVDGDPTTDIMQSRHVSGIWKEGRRWKLEGYREQVAQLRRESGVADPPAREEPPPQLLGEWEDDYGNRFTIASVEWVLHDSSRYDVLRWSTGERYLIARNVATNPSDPGLWTRVDWVELGGMEPWLWAFCLSAYDAESAEAAEAVTIADRTAPRTGCNGFPFSRMKPIA